MEQCFGLGSDPKLLYIHTTFCQKPCQLFPADDNLSKFSITLTAFTSSRELRRFYKLSATELESGPIKTYMASTLILPRPQTYQLWLDRSSTHTAARWISTVVLIICFGARIVLAQVGSFFYLTKPKAQIPFVGSPLQVHQSLWIWHV